MLMEGSLTALPRSPYVCSVLFLGLSDTSVGISTAGSAGGVLRSTEVTESKANAASDSGELGVVQLDRLRNFFRWFKHLFHRFTSAADCDARGYEGDLASLS